MQAVRTKDVQELFKCQERTARKRMREVRIALNKATSNGKGKRGADPITIEQIIEHYRLK